MDRAEELESFKKEIDLVAYAVGALGFRLDQRSRSSARLKKDGDIIVVALSADGHYTYFSPLDDSDNGTIIDLLQHRRKMSLGEVRKELRTWLGRPSQSPRVLHTLSPESHDLAASDRARLKVRLTVSDANKRSSVLDRSRDSRCCPCGRPLRWTHSFRRPQQCPLPA